jgi:hypothetical protein
MYLSPDGMRVNSMLYPKGDGYSVGDVMLPSVRLSNFDFINRRRVDRLKHLNGEVVHSFSMTDNKYCFFRRGQNGIPVIVMCEIPKGETYWLGYGGEYGSLSLKIKEIQTTVWKVDVKYMGQWPDESLVASKSMITIDELKRHLERPESFIRSYSICSYNVLTGESEVVFSTD